jgi:hypothetical protein
MVQSNQQPHLGILSTLTPPRKLHFGSRQRSKQTTLPASLLRVSTLLLLTTFYFFPISLALLPSHSLTDPSSRFQESQYLGKLKASSNLQSLIKREDELDREIKGLDSDIQTLVYENYNKFIR